MKISYLLGLSLIAALCWWWWPKSNTKALDSQPMAVTNPAAQHNTPKPASSAAAPNEAAPVLAPVAPDDMAGVAAQYQALIKYPVYAIPITPQNDYLLTPNRFETVTLPLDEDRSWSLSLSQYRYAYPEPVVASARLTGSGPKPATVRYQLQRLDTLEVLARGELSAASQSAAGQDAADYQLTLAGQNDWPAELRLNIESPDLSNEGVGASFLYVQPVARVLAAGPLQAVETDLQIGLTVEVQQAGLFRVQAVLQQQGGSTETDWQPLAFLQDEVTLKKGRQQFNLKAHHSVLPDQTLELALSHIQLQRASMHPAEPTLYGADQLKPMPLGSFSPSALTKTPYQLDKAEQARLQLLSELQQ